MTNRSNENIVTKEKTVELAVAGTKGQSRALARATINVLTHSLLKAVDAIVGVGHGVSLSSESVASST
jgi:hypothetical protein